MGAFSYPSLVVKSKDGGNREICKSSSESLWDKVLEAQDKRTRKGGKIQNRVVDVQNGGNLIEKRRVGARYLMKGKACRKPAGGNGVVRRIRTLKKLVPNGESMGVDGLFKETTAYILSLQMRVQIMQIMVKVLTDSDN